MNYKGAASECIIEEVLWHKGGMSIHSGNNCCPNCLSDYPKWEKRQQNRATNEFWKRKQQICAGCTATQNGPPVIACEAVAPAASSHEVQWHAAAVAADPAVAVPPGLVPQPPQPPPPPQRPPSVEAISDMMRTMQGQLAALEARVEDSDEVMQTMELRVKTMEAASEDKDEYVKTMELRVKTMELRVEAMGQANGAKTDAQTKAHEETDVPWVDLCKVGIADDANERLPHEMGRLLYSEDIRYT